MNSGDRSESPSGATDEQRFQRIDRLTHLLNGRHWHLRFPEPEESRFQRSQLSYRVQAVRAAALVATPLYVLTSVLDALFIPDTVVRSSMARGVAILACVVIALLMRDRRLRRQAETAALLIVLVLSSCQVFIAGINPLDLQPIHWLVNLLLVMYVVTVIQVRFPMALLVSFLIYLQTVIGAFLFSGLGTDSASYIAYFMLCGITISLFSNFMNERNRRMRYLQRALLSLHRRGLYRQMDQLQRGLDVDQQTGLGSRRGLEEFLQQCFAHLARAGNPSTMPERGPLRKEARQASNLGLLLVSIDHFHAFTSRYGKIEGEFCLTTIAQHLQRSIGGHGNYVARYGDEQFAVVLPGATVFDARATAERLRRDVETMGLPHELTPTGTVTISIGMAHSAHLAEPSHQALMEMADRQLFRAIQEGGNRCQHNGSVNAP